MKSLFTHKTSLFLLSLSISLSVLLGFSLYYNLSVERPIKVIDLNLLTQEQALAWAEENGLKVEVQEAYDETIPVGTVLNQGTGVGERIFAGSTVIVTVSKGPDPEVLVELPDFTGKNIGDVQTFIDTNKLMNASIQFEKSDKIATSFFIRQSLAAGTIKRADKVSFTISTGTKDTLTTVSVPDFSTYTRQQVTSWGSSSNIRINFIEEFNKDYAAGTVFSQSQAANATVYDGSSITVKISLGTGVALENLVGKSKSAIDSFINGNGLKVSYTYSYSASQNKDYATTMKPASGTRVADGSTVEITLSLGKVKITDFTGKTLKEFEAWVTEVNAQGAGLKYTTSTLYSDTVASGKMIKQSPSSGDVNPGTSISVSMSKGGGITVKSFKSRNDTQDGLVVRINEVYSSSTSGTVIDQSIGAGRVVDSGSTITLTVSLGQVPISNFTGNSLGAFKDWLNSVNAKGAQLSYSTSEVYSGTAQGNIVSQSPGSGSVNPSTSITLQISKGAGITVMNFVGSSTTSQSGLNVSISEVFSDSVAKGVVISQSIGAGQVVNSGTSISLVVSKGSEPTIVLPPLAALTGQSTSVDQTKTILSGYFGSVGLTNYSFVTGDYGIGAGQISDQNPAGGSTIKLNTAITVYISNN